MNKLQKDFLKSGDFQPKCVVLNESQTTVSLIIDHYYHYQVAFGTCVTQYSRLASL